jgi:fatty-acyl-CoA synthase
VPPALIDAFHARDIPVAQVYGATETGPVSLVVEPGEAMEAADRSGRAAAGVEVKLGTDGEILLRAPNLMRGYHRQVEPSFDAEGWFDTGDLAVDRGDGWYEVVGRSKELIISGGENIHPAEIENLVAQFPGVAECAVVGLGDERWGEVPVLAVVPRAGETVDGQARLNVLRLALARFKIPRRVVMLAELPRTALGKVQRGALAKTLAGDGVRGG